MNALELISGGLLDLLFPPKCVFCGKLLDGELDLCRHCRMELEEFPPLPPNTHPDRKSRLQFLDSFTAVWYYKERVRDGILGLKFHYRVDYAAPLGRRHGRRSVPCGNSAGAMTSPSSWPRR